MRGILGLYCEVTTRVTMRGILGFYMGALLVRIGFRGMLLWRTRKRKCYQSCRILLRLGTVGFRIAGARRFI